MWISTVKDPLNMEDSNQNQWKSLAQRPLQKQLANTGVRYKVTHDALVFSRIPSLAPLGDGLERSLRNPALLALLLGHVVVGHAYILLGWMVPNDSPC